ncbi:MAG: aspartate dehydrogenase [Candidatus Hydrothermarchaeales archaeon]
MDIALIGCGFIGEFIARAITDGKIDADLLVVLDRHEEKMEKICRLFETRPKVARDIHDILDSDAELVVEAASIVAVRLFALDILKSKKSIMTMSTGAFADQELYDKVIETAKENNVKVYLPSGAIGGLDALRSASYDKIKEVTLETIKHPKSFKGAPYLIKNKIQLEGIHKKRTLYEGNAAEAIKGFPANVNVAVALALAGIGVEKTQVKIIADPDIGQNIHTINVKGEFGEFSFNVKNLPSPKNPKTSYLAALSAIATLQKIISPVKIA